MENKTNFWKIGFIILIVIIVIAAVNFAVWFFVLGNKNQTTPPASTPTPSPPKEQVVCTQEAMLCSDGKTYVSRTGPNCEFAPCPSTPLSPTPSKENEAAAVKAAVYKKLGTDATKTEVIPGIISNGYVKGSIHDIGETSGGYFIAAKTVSDWVVVYNGQATPTCTQLAPYNFPTDMVPECLDQNGNIVKR